MGDLSGIEPPRMNWLATDLPTEFRSFRQYCELIFSGPFAEKGQNDRVTYILLWVGQEGRRMYNTWDLSETDKKDVEVIWAKFQALIEPKSNYRLSRFHLQKFRQLSSETVDEFMTRCKTQARKCKFRDTTETEKRLIEQLVVGGSMIFSKLDVRHGYCSVQLDDESKRLTTFNSPFGRYCFRRLPFGLNLSQDVFQEMMDCILEKCPGTISIADDVGVFGKTEVEHNKHLHNLMRVALQHGLVFNIDKCDIKQANMKFFGLEFSADGVRSDPGRAADIQRMKAPQNVAQLQEFLGIATYMSPFIPNLSQKTATLRDLVKKDAEYIWTDSHNAAFEATKSLICRDVTLAYFDPQAESVIQVDASSRGLGAVLIQHGKPIAFASKSLSDCEQRYANIEREMLAVVFGCERFHMYVYGKSFVLESDHKPLEMINLKNLAAAPQRLQRMFLRVQP